MLNQNLKLNTKIFNNDVILKSTRSGFGDGLLFAGGNDDRIVALTADLTESTKMNLFAERFPDRFFNVGIAEQNLAGVASGLAIRNKIPFIASFGIFTPGRNWEQIRTNICYNNRPVKIAGTHTGLSASSDGGSHQALEDIAITRVLPNMTVIVPCDYLESKKATISISQNDNPTYLRLTRNDTPIITTEETPFEIGKAQIVFTPEHGLAQIGIIASGPILYRAIIAAKELEERGIKVKVMNLSTIKPLDEKAIIELAKETKKIITCEEHQIAGGVGSAVAECLSKNYPTHIEMVGIDNKFGQSGTTEELYKYYGLEKENIIKAVEKLTKKSGN